MITVPLTIDGTSELTSQGTPEIVLSNGGGVATGIVLVAGLGGSTIEGLQFRGFTGPAILVQSAGNTIGGTATGAGNVLSTTGSAGVSIAGASNVLEGNFIGTDASGDDLGTDTLGVVIDDVTSNTIGGTTAGSGNTIAFSSSAEVSITGSSASSNVLEGNFIGTNAAGANLGGGTGVEIDGASNNAVGGTLQGAGQHDRIQWLDHPGALIVSGGTGDAIVNNLVYDNAGSTIASTGIDLTGGGNHSASLPTPSISGVTSSGSGSTVLTLNVSGMIPGDYLLDVFSSARRRFGDRGSRRCPRPAWHRAGDDRDERAPRRCR